MDILEMVKNLSPVYMQEYNLLRVPGRSSDYSTATLQETTLDAIRQYASWVVGFRTSTNPTLQGRMGPAFSKLDNLERIDILYRNPPFKNALLFEAWIQRSNPGSFCRKDREFIEIIRALQKSKSRLKHLTHDHLPVCFFVPRSNFDIGFLPSIFANLQTLHLTFEATTTPHMRFWKNLGEFLRAAPRLKDLRFGFDSPDPGRIMRSKWEECPDPIRWYLPLWKIFGGHQWSELKSLRLDGLTVCEKGLAQFLGQHSKTLRSLELFRIALWQGSFEGLLTGLKSSLQLDTFRIWGTLRAFHTPYEVWRLPEILGDFPAAWSPEFASFMEDITRKNLDAYIRFGMMSPAHFRDQLELFMMSSIDWPLKKRDMLTSIVRPRYRPAVQPLHTPDCCAMSMYDIDRLWENGLVEPVEMWADFDFDTDPISGIVEDEMIEEYYADGFDDEGFDRHGYNEDGMYHLDVPYEWQGAVNPIHPATAHREILAGVLDNISEKAEVSEQILEGDDDKSWSRWISIGPKRV
jgi:hypothetical protein